MAQTDANYLSDTTALELKIRPNLNNGNESEVLAIPVYMYQLGIKRFHFIHFKVKWPLMANGVFIVSLTETLSTPVLFCRIIMMVLFGTLEYK